MDEQIPEPENGFLSRLVPERRIYIRSDTKMRYVSFNPLSQIGLALVTAGFIGWSGFASVAYITAATDVHQADSRVESMREAFEARLAASDAEQRLLEETLQGARDRATLIGDRLSAKQRHAVEIATALHEANLELATLRASYQNLYAERQAEAERITKLDRELARISLELAETRTNHAGMTDAMKVFTETMGDVIAERDHASIISDTLSDEVDKLEVELARWEGRQERVLSQLEEAARTSMSSLEKVFDRANIDLDQILRETKRDYTGSGGPFQPISNSALESDVDDDIRVAALMNDLERVNLMRVAADRLPFGRPVTGARKTSGFGIRRDPIRRRSSMHSGVDFAAPRGTPIFTTAAGIVTFAGRQSGYGITVKIRHAFGFETVYAHLSRARVKVGQHVERGDRIADMGSTGRSTGTHLHYEVRINKEPVNPATFIEAARDVL